MGRLQQARIAAYETVLEEERRLGISLSQHVCLQVTYRCNYRCHGCYACCDLLSGDDSDMTVEQVLEFCEQVKYRPLKSFRIAGGEPTLLPELRDMVWAIHHRANFRGWAPHVSTNGSGPRFKLPRGWRWRVSPAEEKPILHEPWLWSPDDIGEDSRGFVCKRPVRCGMGYDYRGWSFCQVAAGFSRLLGIEIHTKDRRPEYLQDVCKHCPWSLSDSHRAELYASTRWKKVTLPTTTWRAALERTARRR